MGKNIEVYIDDIGGKSKVVSEHVRDLRDIFEILRKHKLCLNASKCSFSEIRQVSRLYGHSYWN